MKELTCIVCPRGCHLKVDEKNGYAVSGNGCPRGAVYGRRELMNPTRVVTSTVRTTSAEHPRCPVKTSEAIPKGDIFRAMALLNDVTLEPPIACGQVVIPHILGSEVSFIATRDIEK